MVNKFNDATQDAAQAVDTSVIVGDSSFGSSDIYDLKQLDPASFKVRLEWAWVAAPGAIQIVSVIGSTDAAGTDSYLLGSMILGDPATVATVVGVTPSGDYTGTGAYVIPCSNLGYRNTIATLGQQSTVVCRYVKVCCQTSGLGSACAFVARIDHN